MCVCVFARSLSFRYFVEKSLFPNRFRFMEVLRVGHHIVLAFHTINIMMLIRCTIYF